MWVFVVIVSIVVCEKSFLVVAPHKVPDIWCFVDDFVEKDVL